MANDDEILKQARCNVGSLVLCLSAGRSGTQWLAKIIEECCSRDVVVTHEPISYNYMPKLTLRGKMFESVYRECKILRDHLEYIDDLLSSGKNYVELGWPIFSWIPFFVEKYKTRVRLIHLTRHPVYYACSHATHNYYRPEVRSDGYVKYAQLDPYDLGVKHKEYRDIWNGLTVYEKCLYQWLEIHDYALDLHEHYPDVKYVLVKMEDMIKMESSSIQAIADITGIERQRIQSSSIAKVVVDKFRGKTRIGWNLKCIHNHGEVIRMANLLGYKVDNFDIKQIFWRYEANEKPSEIHWSLLLYMKVRSSLKKIEKQFRALRKSSLSLLFRSKQ